MIENILYILLVIVAFRLVTDNSSIRLIVFFSAFSLVIAALYFFLFAPDVALAEIVVGSAFIPLIFIITTTRKLTYTVYIDYMNMRTQEELDTVDIIIERLNKISDDRRTLLNIEHITEFRVDLLSENFNLLIRYDQMGKCFRFEHRGYHIINSIIDRNFQDFYLCSFETEEAYE